jgi:hypothetical protein
MSAEMYTTNPTLAAGGLLLGTAWAHRHAPPAPAPVEPLGWGATALVALGILYLVVALNGNFGIARATDALVSASRVLACLLLLPAAWLWHAGGHDVLAATCGAGALAFVVAPRAIALFERVAGRRPAVEGALEGEEEA